MTFTPRQVCPACGYIFDPPTGVPPGSQAGTMMVDSDETTLPPSTPELAAVALDPILMTLAEEKPSPVEPIEPPIVVGRSSTSGTGSFDMFRITPTASTRTRTLSSDDFSSRSGEVEPEPRSRKSGLLLTLLLSYASAATLGLIWFVVIPKIKARKSGDSTDVTASSGGDSADPGTRAASSRRVEPPAPVPEANRTELGKPLKVGSVEITPLDVVRKPIVLLRNRVTGGVERREDVEHLLVLRLRFRNISDNLIFAPFDERFVRDNEQGMSDSLVEFGDKIWVYPYPLARESEWSIEGQSFREIKPGETMETVFVTSVEGSRLEADQLFWRIRVRTGISQTTVVGVTTDAPQE